MNITKFITGFLTIFIITLAVSAGVTYLWSLIFHDMAKIDWETSVRLAIIFGILFTYLDRRKDK